MSVAISAIYRYPVKGLNGESLDSVQLSAGEGLPHDRRFALAHASSQFDRTNPQWLPKTNFLTLMRDERLAMLDALFDPETGVLRILRDGRQVARGDITQQLGRTLIEQFLDAFMPSGPRGNPHIVEAPGAMLSDVGEKVVSIINLASVRDIERVVRAAVDPRRFRGNVLIEGAPAWAEARWVGREIAFGGVRLSVTKVIERCAAIEVDPQTANRDIHLLRPMRQGFGHIECGIYASVLTDGILSVGDAVVPPD